MRLPRIPVFLLTILVSSLAFANVTITGSKLPAATQYVAYSGSVTADNGCVPYKWTVNGTIPPGIVATPPTQTTTNHLQSMLFTGTPSTPGSYAFNVTVTGCHGRTSTLKANIAVASANQQTPVITSGANASVVKGNPFSYQITASNSPTSFAASGLPAGLSVSQAGLITGTPSTAGTYTSQISASNASGTGSATLTITVTDVVAHTVTLDWNPPASDYVYFSVYRGTQSGGPYQQIASNIAASQFVDQNVQSGAKYFYVVTDTDNSGAESVKSSQAQAIIP